MKILRGADILPGQIVLEVGCGTGYFTLPAARLVGKQGCLVAMDVLSDSVLGDANHGLESRMTVNNHPSSDTQPTPRQEVEAFYEIRVKGHLGLSWSDWLGGLALTPQPGGETLLSGSIIDQAALHGILDKLYAMNLTILSVVQVKNDQEMEGKNV